MGTSFDQKNKKTGRMKLPSPSGMAKGTFSKSINLLPNYTEYESQKYNVYGPYRLAKSGSLPPDEDGENQGTEGSEKSAEKKIKINPKKRPDACFRQPELVYLNKKPNYEYLNPNKYQMKVRRVVRVPRQTEEFKKEPTFRVTKDTKYQPFNTEKYNAIVK